MTRDFGLPDDAAHVNPNGGAVPLGHRSAHSGGRLAMTAAYQLKTTAAATPCAPSASASDGDRPDY